MLCQNNFTICSIWMLFSQLKIYQGQPTANLTAITVISTDPFPNPKKHFLTSFGKQVYSYSQAVALHLHHSSPPVCILVHTGHNSQLNIR